GIAHIDHRLPDDPVGVLLAHGIEHRILQPPAAAHRAGLFALFDFAGLLGPQPERRLVGRGTGQHADIGSGYILAPEIKPCLAAVRGVWGDRDIGGFAHPRPPALLIASLPCSASWRALSSLRLLSIASIACRILSGARLPMTSTV